MSWKLITMYFTIFCLVWGPEQIRLTIYTQVLFYICKKNKSYEIELKALIQRQKQGTSQKSERLNKILKKKKTLSDGFTYKKLKEHHCWYSYKVNQDKTTL